MNKTYINHQKKLKDMKKTYRKPETQTVVIELTKMIALSQYETNATSGEVLSRDGGGNFWDDEDDY